MTDQQFMWDQIQRALHLLEVRGGVGLGVGALGPDALGLINSAISDLRQAQRELDSWAKQRAAEQEAAGD